jgi:cell fate (sporulation/competence/biofilm development) regulator YlbF (YheA/YmcA/DUF963 family)
VVRVGKRARTPLISISYQERFIDIVRTLNEQIVQSSLTLVKRALYINQVLSRLVLDERGLQDVADELARLIAQSVSTSRMTALMP